MRVGFDHQCPSCRRVLRFRGGPDRACLQRIPGELNQLIEEGLQLRLRVQAAGPVRSRKPLPVFKGRGGLVAGLDPRSNKAMLQALADNA